MPTPEQMTAAVHAYVDAFDKGDPELAVAIFAVDAVIEDPIGTPPKCGHDAIREFYQMSMATGAKLVLDGPVRVGADHAAFAFHVRTGAVEVAPNGLVALVRVPRPRG